MRIIITGGTGLIGSKLVSSLAAEQHEVLVLSRSPEKYTFPAGVMGVKWNGRTAEGWGDLVNETDAIINLAGENISGTGFLPSRWTPERKQRIRDSRVQAGEAIVAAVEAAANKPSILYGRRNPHRGCPSRQRFFGRGLRGLGAINPGSRGYGCEPGRHPHWCRFEHGRGCTAHYRPTFPLLCRWAARQRSTVVALDSYRR